MRQIIGRREDPNPDLKATFNMLHLIVRGVPVPTQCMIRYPCEHCGRSIHLFLWEDIPTGTIFRQTAQTCPRCGNQLDFAWVKPLSQEVINQLFGPL